MMNFDHVGISVCDLGAQVQWYAQAFGLEQREPSTVPSLGMDIVFMVHPDQSWALELIRKRGSARSHVAADPGEALLTQGYGHICLRVSDVRGEFDRLRATGAAVLMEPRESPMPGVTVAFLADPEGNLIELIDRAGPPGSRD